MTSSVSLISEHLKNKAGFCLYRFPGKKNIHFISEIQPNKKTKKVDFVFAPFDLKLPEIVLKKQSVSNYKSLKDFFLKHSLDTTQLSTSKAKETPFSTYQKGFQIIKNKIDKGELQKAILSIKSIQVNSTENSIAALTEEVFSKHPLAFCTLFFHPNCGLWLGASPETILKQKNSHFETVALAGTKANQFTKWKEKEKIEHQIVAQSIQNELKHLQLNYELGRVFTANAGNLYHLKQVIRFAAPPELTLIVLKKLHPTPAIGGNPKIEALKTISEVEKHSREYYCGYLGLQDQTKTQFYVNLRCLKISKNVLEIFSGSGITNGSELQSEWEECKRKAENIINLNSGY